MKEHKTYDVYYDEGADFLEVSFEKPAKECITEEVQEGVFVTRDKDSGNITNIGILSFKKRVNLLDKILTQYNMKLPLNISI